MLSQNTIQTEIIYLASFESHRHESSAFAVICTPTPPDDYRMYDIAKNRLPIAKNAPTNAGSTLALRWAKNYISPSVDTILRFTLPWQPDEIDFSFFPRLELEPVSKEQNPAWFQLVKASGAIKPE